MKDNENIAKAFTEWLDKEKKEYFILIRDLDGDGINFCSLNGQMESLSVTLSSGMIDHEPVEQLLSNAVMMTAVKKYADEHNIDIDDLMEDKDDND